MIDPKKATNEKLGASAASRFYAKWYRRCG